MSLEVACEPLAGLTPEWWALQRACAADSIFLTPLWQHAWSEANQGKNENQGLLTVREGKSLLGVAPLQHQDGRLSFAADPNVTDYQDILAVPGQERGVWSAILDHTARKEVRAIDLTGIRADSASTTLVPELAKEHGWKLESSIWDVSPYIQLPATWEDYVQGLDKKDRHELRRKFRRLESSGRVEYVVLDGRSEGLAEGLASFFDLMRKSREEKAHFLTEEREVFFTAMARTLAEAGHFRLFFLRLDGLAIGSALCFDYGDELLLYNSGFDPAYRSLSAGLLLKAWCIRYAIEQGRRSFDFLRGDEPYKYDLGGVDRAIYRFVLER